MTNDDHSEDADLSQKNGGDDSDDTGGQDDQQDQDNGQQSDQKEGKQDGESQVDYRARLNAQNRFLEKEGYEFQKGRGWVKKVADGSRQQSNSQDKTDAKPALSREEAILI